MELRHLRYFVAVAKHLSFTAASKSIHVAQAALSETVKNLELEMGVELLARTRQSVALTAAGESFLRDSERILRDVEEASRSADLVARGEEGRLSIGFLGGTAASFLPRLLRVFRRRHPHVQLSIFDGSPRELSQALAEGRIDLAITRPEVEHGHQIPMQQFQIFASELCAVFPRDHAFAEAKGPLPIRKLSGEPIVLDGRVNSPWVFDTVIASCRRAGFLPRIVLTPNHLSTVIVLVEAGLGVGIVSAAAIHGVSGKKVNFRPLSPKSYPVPTLLVWPRGLLSPTAEAFIELVRAQAPGIAKAMSFPAR